MCELNMWIWKLGSGLIRDGDLIAVDDNVSLRAGIQNERAPKSRCDVDYSQPSVAMDHFCKRPSTLCKKTSAMGEIPARQFQNGKTYEQV